MRFLRFLKSGTFLTLLAILGPPAIGSGLYLYADTHQILPGLDGCRVVRQQSAQIDCYAGQIQKLVDKNGVDAAVRTVNNKAKRDSSLANDCHLALHQVGARAARKVAKSKSDLPNIPSSSHCKDGYVHGFQIAYLQALDFDNDSSGTKQVSKLCNELKPYRAAINCVHAFGHVVARTQSESTANKRCNELSLTQNWKAGSDLSPRARFECGFGMYMELSLLDIKSNRKLSYNCSKAKLPTRISCYAFLPLRMLSAGISTPHVVIACERAPEPSERQICLGAIVSQQNGNTDACKIAHFKEDRPVCFEIANRELSPTQLLERVLLKPREH